MRIRVQIIDISTGEPVDADLFDEVTIEHFLETQTQWRPVIAAAREHLRSTAAPGALVPQHYHWDWTEKEPELRMLAVTFWGIECKGQLQGVMKVQTVGYSCRLPSQAGKPLVYIDYLEAAPWNIKALMQALGRSHRFGAVGTRLVEAAVRQSMEEGFNGRIGLHSLSSSESFYRNVCGMTPLGCDPAVQNLLWFELTPENAERFLAGDKA